jgi:hypothetical protein
VRAAEEDLFGEGAILLRACIVFFKRKLRDLKVLREADAGCREIAVHQKLL